MDVFDQHMPRVKARGTLKDQLDAFAADEDGATLVFSLCTLVVIFMVAGLAVDVAIYEDYRARMQQTADRAVLAAADLDQTRDAEEVVNDYFSAAGLEDTIAKVDVTKTLNSKRVEAVTEIEVPTYFSHLVGIDSFTTPARSVAEERITDVEISVVLDVSGSMGSNNKIGRLRDAASDFFDTVLLNGDGLTTVSVVTYNQTVSVGPSLLSRFNTDGSHTLNSCIRFRDDEFNTVAIGPDTPLEMHGHFDNWRDNHKKPSGHEYWCKIRPDYEILPFQTNPSVLKDYVSKLNASGSTAIDVGMKWGSALIDPAIRPILSDMVDDGELGPKIKANGLPRDYGDPDVMKVIVLMTDGQNWQQLDLKDEFKTGQSGVYYSRSAGGNRDYDSNNNNNGFYVEIPNNSSSQRFYRPRNPKKTSDDQYVAVDGLPSDAVELSNIQLYNRFAVDDAATMMWKHSDKTEYERRRNATIYHDQFSEADDRLKALCDKVNEPWRNVNVYTIGFEAPKSGRLVMEYCASTPGHFFDIKGTDISVAFASIASSINKLRLTQ